MSIHVKSALERKERINEIRRQNLSNYKGIKITKPIKIDSNKESSNTGVNNIVEFSSTAHTEDELRQAMLSKKEVCVSYVCRHTPMSEDFILEFTGLTTGEFNFSNYNKEACMIIGDLLMKSPSERDDIIDLIRLVKKGEMRIDQLPEPYNKLEGRYLYMINSTIRDRMDWLYIGKYQNISKEFSDKYKSVLKNFIDTPYTYNKPEEY